MFVIAALCVIIGLLYFIYEIKTSRMKRLTSNMPHPKSIPFVGCALEFSDKPDEILQTFLKISSLGPVVPIWIGTELYILLSGVNEIQTILSSNKIIKKSKIYDYLYPWLGCGLVLSDGEVWHKQRKMITPAFHFKMLEQFVDIFSSNINILIDKLENEVGNKGIDISKLMVLCTLDIISETSMGIQINAQLQEKENSFVQAIYDVSLIFLLRTVRPWLYLNFAFNLSPEGRLFNRQIDVIQKFIQEVIDSRRKLKAKTKTENVNEEDTEIFGKKKKSVFLDLLLDYNLTDEEIRSHVNTFMFAGHDTTTQGICFALYSLMKHSEIQEKVYKEQIEILVDPTKSPTYQDLKSMKYLECVINETLRVYPSIPIIGRKITEDFQLTPEYVLPKGSSVSLFLYKLHHDPDLFPNPEVYDPDRFLPDQVRERHPYAFCPFSAGSRNCIGQKFAMLEMKTIIAAVVRKFKILPPIDCPDIVLGTEVTLESVTGVYIRLENR